MPTDAYSCNIYLGTAPDKLYNCIMVLNSNEYWFKGMDKDKPYYFSAEAINESGISERTKVIRVK
jgi:xylan 1,4-beta-xylosidase